MDLRAYRTAKGWTQDRLGEELGVTGRHVAAIEQGRFTAGPATRAKLGLLMIRDALDTMPLDGRDKFIYQIIDKSLGR